MFVEKYILFQNLFELLGFISEKIVAKKILKFQFNPFFCICFLFQKDISFNKDINWWIIFIVLHAIPSMSKVLGHSARLALTRHGDWRFLNMETNREKFRKYHQKKNLYGLAFYYGLGPHQYLLIKQNLEPHKPKQNHYEKNIFNINISFIWNHTYYLKIK